MIQVHDQRFASVVALMEVEPDQTHLYGIATVESTDEDDVVRITGLVEKPQPENAPSRLAVIGRYVLQPDIFPILEATEPGSGGEIQLTDALNALAASELGGGVFGVVFTGRRYDTGDRLDYLKAIVQVAASRDDLGPDFVAWLKRFSASV
jgi:UTP--glucose-1-phosphate uridylyltransferase